jgi:PhoD-like phosphatase
VPRLVLGPLLRYVGEDHAVIWVEADAPCQVEALGARERTFRVAGHHYALLQPGDLEPGAWHEYEVLVDGRRAWPEPDSPFPPSRFQTYPKSGPLRVAFGSCRVAAPHEPPFILTRDQHFRGREVDALYGLARRMIGQDPELWPDVLLMLGDQVYADEVSPETSAFMEARRDLSRPPGTCVLDFEEYTRLYHESWSDPTIRWLLSTVSTAMVFDDHDMHDDWNISQAWVDEMRAQDWWDEHVAGAFSSYWIYQHLGNLAPGAHEDNELLQRVQAEEDGAALLRDFALRADRETSGARWSYCRDLGATRLVVIDSRAGRVVEEGRRSMVDDGEWDWIAEHATGGFDHLLIATSLPFLLARGMHWLEAWNEAVCAGAWGDAAAHAGEKVRQAVDLEHWGSFVDSFGRLAELQRSVAAGERGRAPASIVTLSGDVHHAYLCEVAFRKGVGARSAVWQAVCSPFRNPLEAPQRAAVRLGCSRPFEAVTRAAARAAGVPDPPIRWRMAGGGPWFDNQIALLEVDGRRLDVRIESPRPDGVLEPLIERRLA